MSALALAGALQEIAARLVALHASARVFTYLDDIVVVVPPAVSVEAARVAETVLAQWGLAVNDKTRVWARDPGTPLPLLS